MLKLALKITKPETKAEIHVLSEKKDWGSFEKNLRTPAFRNAILKMQSEDPKLVKYVKTFGAYQGSKDVVATIKSANSGKTYKIKDLHNGRWGCNCKDWQFVHSIGGGDCKHIKSVKSSRLVKAAMAGVGFTMVSRASKVGDKRRKNEELLHALGGPTKSQQYLPKFTHDPVAHVIARI